MSITFTEVMLLLALLGAAVSLYVFVNTVRKHRASRPPVDPADVDGA